MLANGSMRLLAFVMQAGATATLCVTYSSGRNVTTTDLAAGAWIVNATKYQDGYGYSYARAPSINLNMTSLSRNPSGGNVTYLITASSNAGGFYSLRYPGICGFVPFAVVTGPLARVSSSDFPGFFMISSCPLYGPFNGWSRIIGFSGMTTVWLTG